jgi:hypothetical protein
MNEKWGKEDGNDGVGVYFFLACCFLSQDLVRRYSFLVGLQTSRGSESFFSNARFLFFWHIAFVAVVYVLPPAQ